MDSQIHHLISFSQKLQKDDNNKLKKFRISNLRWLV